ncbi:hypothetical protein PoB_005324900 [Plakobranchus ocellatus]|uniref:Uncharacterized protein n=1 Tax=Plakobranchus ocellatus TaxID=259542 RepID=A0AAV4C7Q8_9GAST|nr:hypothetical protein PoB_005324900 [Plakobranchus ocellatus]
MGCRHSRYGDSEDSRVESLHYKKRRSTKVKRSGRRRKKSAASNSSNTKQKSSISSGTSDPNKSSALSGEEEEDRDVGHLEAERLSRTPSLDRGPLSEEKEEEEFDAIGNGKQKAKNKKGKKVKVKKGQKVRDKEKEKDQRRTQQLFGPGHQQTASNVLSLSVATPASDSSFIGGSLHSSDQRLSSLPARLLAHYKRAFPVWEAADYHFRQDGRGLTLSTLSGAGVVCQCGKGVGFANGAGISFSINNPGIDGGAMTSSSSADTGESSSKQHPTSSSSSSSSTAAAVGISGRTQCRRCSLAAAKRAGLLPNNNNGSLDGGSAAGAAAEDVGGGDNGAAASGASPDVRKLQNNIDAIANFLVLVGLFVCLTVLYLHAANFLVSVDLFVCPVSALCEIPGLSGSVCVSVLWLHADKFLDLPVPNKVVSCFQVLRQARTPVAELEPAMDEPLHTIWRVAIHSATDAPQVY